MIEQAAIFAIERPHPRLLTLYMLRAVLSGPALLVMGPLLFFRYHTLRYRFDDEGIHMRWGLLFRHEINLTYARIQDIHLTSGLLQRWLGLADVQIQTASSASSAEMTIEGLLEYKAVRDYLYTRMRGYRPPGQTSGPGAAQAGPPSLPGAPGERGQAEGELATLLREAVAELRAARIALERREAAGAEVEQRAGELQGGREVAP